MKKEDKEKEILKLELEKIKIEHNTDMNNLNQKNWVKITMIFGGLIAVLNIIGGVVPQNYMMLSAIAVLVYILILHSAAESSLTKKFYGKAGLIKKYNEKFNELQNKIKNSK